MHELIEINEKTRQIYRKRSSILTRFFNKLFSCRGCNENILCNKNIMFTVQYDALSLIPKHIDELIFSFNVKHQLEKERKKQDMVHG